MKFSSFLPFALSLSLSVLPSALAGRKVPRDHPHNTNHPHAELLKRSLTTDPTTVNGNAYDFVIVGGGLAGLAIAARLTEWSNITVLVIEAGGDGSDVETQIDVPGYSYLHSLTGSAYDWQYYTTTQTDSLNRKYYWPRGKGLGGSGAINGMFWCRASSAEYDAWATLNPNGAQTWNWEEVNKYIMKAENFSQPNSTVQNQFGMVLNTSAHGSGGPIQSGFSEYIFPVVSNWIPTWKGMGFTAKDLAGGDNHGVMITPSTLNMRNQSRSDSKAGYIDPLAPRSNLVILTKQQVTSITFNGTKDSSGNILASGVTFQASSTSTAYSVQANKEVILAGGTVGSAQLLQLSGIGPNSLLSGLGITTRVDLPVGYNLQDHVSYSMYWSTTTEFTWYNFYANDTMQAQALTEWENYGTGLWTYINEAVGYVSMSDINGGSTGASTYASAVQSAMATTVSDVTSWMALPSNVATGMQAQYNIQQQWLTEDVGQLEIILTTWGQGDNNLGIQVALQHPWSRGTLMINTTSAFDQPQINPDYFGVGYDTDILVLGSEWVRTLAAAAPMSSVMLTESAPGSTVTGDALGNYSKTNAGTEYHPLGTCAMLPQASGGVVDTNLIVYGTGNIRVIDASIIPLHISAHLMSTTYGIAEKGADIIKQKYWAASGNSGSTATTTATAGKATDTSVTGANANKSNSSSSTSGLSTGAITGIAVGVGVGAGAVLIGLLVWCCLRRRKNKRAPVEKGWYNPGDQDGAWDAAAADKEARNAYPMANFQDRSGPSGPYGHQRQFSAAPSVDTMATGDLMTGRPMRSESGYGLAAAAGMPGERRDSGYSMGDYQRGGGAMSPYRDFEDPAHPGSPSYTPPGGNSGYATPQYMGRGDGGYDYAASSIPAPQGAARAQQAQHYVPVQPR